MKFYWSLLILFMLLLVGCNHHLEMGCQDDKFCVSARSSGDSVLLYLHNNSDQFVYVPEITDLSGPGIGFSISPSSGDSGRREDEGLVPLPPYDGQFVGLRPMAVYGVLLKNEDVKKIYGLDSGCQSLVVQAVVLSSPRKEIVGAKVAGYGSISKTTVDLCL